MESADSPERARTGPRRSRRRRRKEGSGNEDSRQVVAEQKPARSDRSGVAPASRGGDGAPERTSRNGSQRRRRRGKRGGRNRSGSVAIDLLPGEDDDLGEILLPPRSIAGEKKPPPEKAKEERKRHPRPQKQQAEDAEDEHERPHRAPRANANFILVNAADAEETRVAVVEDGRIVDFQMTVKTHKTFVNDIYRGKVVNLEPAIGAAFVDFGQGRNGFLHTSDVISAYGEKDWKLEKLLQTRVDPEEWQGSSGVPADIDVDENGEEAPERGRSRARPGRTMPRPRLPITDLLQKGQSVVVQVTKDAIGDKGPTLTTYISIPGRYLVLMPSMARNGVSRKIEDDRERRRLKRILKSMKTPEGMGVIVRTAGIGRTKSDLQRDLEYLLALWEDFGKRLVIGRGPMELYEESDVAIRTMRDLFNESTEAVWVDEPRVHERLVAFTEKLMPDMVGRIRLHDGARPLFHTMGVEQDFERLFARRIDLPSGGSIVFDQTEALVAIDVNSGKTRTEGFNFEEIALRSNLEAVPEIARQIRLRDLGGIIVCDFIDMQRMTNRRAVERAFKEAMDRDRARSKIGRISQFGLLELTRQRLGPGLSKMLYTICPRCRGSGRVRTETSRAGALLRRLGSAMLQKGFSRIEVRAQPSVIDHLERHNSDQLSDLQRRHERELVLVRVPDQVEDGVLRYLRADGREVRPGGRRKH